MSKAIFLVCLFVFAGIVSAKPFDTFSSLWQSWKLRHNKSYGVGEEAARFAIFVENVNKITKHNSENSEVKFAINKFADLTAAEFKSTYASCNHAQANKDTQKNAVRYNLADPLPDQVDWRAKGAITPVKDQGQCGSCWTFSATGVIEGFYFINHGQLLSFSEQQIVDCDTDEDEGCNGGWHYLAIEYAGKKGLELETDYPYTARDGKCKYDASKAVKTNNGYAYVTANSTDNLKAALVNGPVSVAIEADQSVFQFYSKGVISAGCGADLDHAVMAVGYTKVGILEAFIVKNSWGKSWGDQGYVYLSTIQQLNRGQGACGILAIPVIVN